MLCEHFFFFFVTYLTDILQQQFSLVFPQKKMVPDENTVGFFVIIVNWTL